MWTRLIIGCLFFYSCSSSRQVETRLYFGQFKLDGGTLSEKEWNSFVEQYVAKVFPDGSTIENATGNWYDTAQHKLVTEPSKVVIAIGKPSAAFETRRRMFISTARRSAALYYQHFLRPLGAH